MAIYTWGSPTRQINLQPGQGNTDAVTVLQLANAVANATGVPGGSNTYVQFNNASAFGGTANLTFNTATNNLAVGGGITASGAITVTGNITSTSGAFTGNGAGLTNVPSSYGNTQVFNYLQSYNGGLPSLTGNVTTTANISGAYILGNGSQLTGLPASYANANVTALLSAGISSNIVTSGNITGNVVSTLISSTTSQITIDPVSDGSSFTGNVVVLGNLTVGGNLTYNNATSATTGNLLWIAANNANSAAAASGGGLAVGPTGAPYATWTYNSTNSTWNSNIAVVANGNITGSYFIGNGSQLTGLPATYGNSNVAAYMPSYLPTNTANVGAGNLAVTGVSTFGPVGNVKVTGGSAGQVIITDGAGNLSFGGVSVAQVPSVSFTVPATGNNQSFSNVILGSYPNALSMTVFYNGALINSAYYSLVGDNLTVNIPLVVGDSIDVATGFGGNVTSTTSAYGNSNVANYLSGGSFSSNVFTSGNITGSYLFGNGSLLTGISSLNSIFAGTSNVSIPVNDGNVNFNVNGTQIGAMTASGLSVTQGTITSNTAAAFTAGPAANSAVALLMNGTDMAIRDTASAPSTMFFDIVNQGASANGTFQFRSGSSYTQFALLNSSGLSLPTTQTDLGNVGTTVNYNPSTNTLTKAPAMSAYAGFQAPFNGQLTNANMGQWIQANGDVTMPNYTTVPAGAVFTVYSQGISAQVPLTMRVFNNSTDFFYNPPAQDVGTTTFLMYQGQWAQFLSRGTGEWDIIASNLQEPFKKTVNLAAIDQVVGLDNLNFRVQSNLFLYASPISGSLTGAGSSLTLSLGDGPANDSFTSRSMNAGTWYQVTSTRTLGDDGDSIITIMQDQTNHRTYRVTVIRNSSVAYSITVERISG